MERWKKGSVRDEAGANVRAIQKDLQTTLPPLVKTADAATDAVTGLLPVSRNINALYEVLLRVEEAARIAAPADQAAELWQALVRLGDARRAMDDRIEQAALAEEKQVADLRTTVKAQADAKASSTPVAATCPPPAPTAKAKRKPAASSTKSTTAKPSTTPPAGTSPSTTPGTGK
jgi:virulence-associated protein VagC